MSHKSIRLLLEDTANGLADDVQFSYGTETDFNQSKKSGVPLIHIDPLNVSPSYQVNGVSNYMKQWQVTMVFLKYDNSRETEYTKILDDLDPLVDTFINKLNFFSHQSDQITISSISVTSLIKVYADILSGWRLDFNILASDDFQYCEEC